MKDIKELINFSIINIDKPSGPTSFSVSDFVRKKLQISKTSHMGTLDPKVTGVLPITLGRACRLAGFLIGHDKSYIGILHTHKPQEIKELQKIINEKFTGKIKQTPPHKSAVKRAPRERTIHKFNLIEESPDKKYFLFECDVEGGTYIRKICSDLGEIIGGANMAELRRTKAGIFDESKIFTLQQFENAADEYKNGDDKSLRQMLTPAEEVIKKLFKHVQLKKESLKSLYTGKPLFKKDIISKEKDLKENFAAFHEDIFIGIYRKTNEETILGRPLFVLTI
jgi:H/ACA ribonucleoprotein complex subunit 4